MRSQVRFLLAPRGGLLCTRRPARTTARVLSAPLRPFGPRRPLARSGSRVLSARSRTRSSCFARLALAGVPVLASLALPSLAPVLASLALASLALASSPTAELLARVPVGRVGTPEVRRLVGLGKVPVFGSVFGSVCGEEALDEDVATGVDCSGVGGSDCCDSSRARYGWHAAAGRRMARTVRSRIQVIVS